MRRTLLALTLIVPALLAQEAAAPAPVVLTLEQKETFLKSASLKKTKGAKKGVTGTVRATLEHDALLHDCSIQRIDDEQQKYQTERGTEYNFRDSWKFNVAAYRLGRMLGLDKMIPPSIERTFDGKKGAWTWWVEDVQMDEVERLKRKISAPDKDQWSRQYLIMKVFDQLIFNTDRNATNILYDKDWHLWMIDHTRAFRLSHKLMDEKSLDKIDRAFFERLKLLDEVKVKQELGPYLRPMEIKAVMARRDVIVSHFERMPERLYDYLVIP